MKVTVDYTEIREAIEERVSDQLHVNEAAVSLVRIVRGKGENIYAVVEVDLDKSLG